MTSMGDGWVCSLSPLASALREAAWLQGDPPQTPLWARLRTSRALPLEDSLPVRARARRRSKPGAQDSTMTGGGAWPGLEPTASVRVNSARNAKKAPGSVRRRKLSGLHGPTVTPPTELRDHARASVFGSSRVCRR